MNRPPDPDPDPDPDLVRARALRGRAPFTPPGFKPPDQILDSWARCLDHGLDYAARLRLPVVSAGELAARRESAATVRRLARAELETLMQQIAGSNHLLAFADADGVLLDVLTDNRFAMNCDEEIVNGSCWREEVAGTNGLGTALAAGQGIAVTGNEHYFLRLADISCTASPIRDADGAIVGLLDASSYVKERQRHTLALVQMSTAHIENVLMAEQCAGHLLLAIHPRREFLRTLGAGIMAFDDGGVLRALNARARALLAGLPAARGTPFEALFGERFASFVDRLQARGEVALRDALGSALLARWVGPRPPNATPRRSPAPPTAPALPRFVAEDECVAAALRTAEQALRHGLPMVLLGPPGSGKKRLLREALRAHAGEKGALGLVHAAALDRAGLEAALAMLDAPDPGVLVLHEIDRLGSAEQEALLCWLDERRQHGRRAPLATTLSTEPDASKRVPTALFFRLTQAEVRLPALHERTDFAACARHALDEVARNAHLDPSALDALSQRAWPGNWRELQSVLARAAMAALATSVSPEGPVLIEAGHLGAFLPPAAAVNGAASVLHREATARVLRELERQGGSVSATARRLGVSRNTVYRHLREAKMTHSSEAKTPPPRRD